MMMALVDGAAYEQAIAENEMLAGDLLTTCTLLAVEKELTDAAFVVLTGFLYGDNSAASNIEAAKAWQARYREARQR